MYETSIEKTSDEAASGRRGRAGRRRRGVPAAQSQRLLQRACFRPFRRDRFLQSGWAPTEEPISSLQSLFSGELGEVARSYRSGSACACPDSGRAGRASHLCRTCELAHPGRGAEPANRSNLVRACEPLLVRGAQAIEPAGRRLPASTADRCRADHAQSLRSP